MRWDRLFGDLEAQFDQAAAEEFAAEVADRTRREVARIRLADRFRGAVGASIDLALEGAGSLVGVVRRAGLDWLLLEPAGGGEVVVASRAVLSVGGLTGAAQEPDSWSAVEVRLDLGHVLRAVARDRSPVMIVLRDGSTSFGTVDRVGADFLDLTELPAGEVRRRGEVATRRAVSLEALALIRPG